MKNLISIIAQGARRSVVCRFAAGGLGLLGSLVLLAGCADADAPVDRTAMLPADQQVSSVPWNKPQGWENKSQLGALANDPRIGGQQ